MPISEGTSPSPTVSNPTRGDGLSHPPSRFPDTGWPVRPPLPHDLRAGRLRRRWPSGLAVGLTSVRATLKTHDGALIYVTYRGIFSASQESWEKLARGEPVDRDQYYFYTAPIFQTSAPDYLWLNRLLGVGIGTAVPGGVSYRVFALL